MKRIALLLVLALALRAGGQTVEGAGIVYGSGHAFALQAPAKWVLDNATGQGLCAVFYPVGSNWGDSDVVMYANTARKVEGQQTVAELMAYDVSQFKRRATGLEVTELPELKTDDGKPATVRRFQGDEHGNHEAVAYIDEQNAIVMLVLTARTQERYEEMLPAFEKLVKSYRFLTTDVRFKE